jgi:hypothetical protein
MSTDRFEVPEHPHIINHTSFSFANFKVSTYLKENSIDISYGTQLLRQPVYECYMPIVVTGHGPSASLMEERMGKEIEFDLNPCM